MQLLIWLFWFAAKKKKKKEGGKKQQQLFPPLIALSVSQKLNPYEIRFCLYC